MFWFQTISTGAPSSIAAWARAFQVGQMSTSPLLSICEVWAPPSHQTATCGLIRSRLANARSRSSGYSSSGGTPSASSASSSVSNTCRRNDRRPGKPSTSHMSAQLSGALRPSKASVRYARIAAKTSLPT